MVITTFWDALLYIVLPIVVGGVVAFLIGRPEAPIAAPFKSTATWVILVLVAIWIIWVLVATVGAHSAGPRLH